MNTPKQGFFESDDDYRERVAREADERTIENTTGDAAHQGFFESDHDYRDRISLEANEGTIEDTTGDAPHQSFFESNHDYRERASLEAAEDTIEDLTDDAPHQGFFESDHDYRERVSLEADQAIIENATGDAPHQGFLESDDDYRERISLEADEHRASGDDNSSGGCFITTACVEFAGLPDNCHELTLLRQFRDTYMMALPGGPGLIAEYYRTAPAIVAAIAASPRKPAALRSAWTAVRKAVGAIDEEGDYHAALIIYCAMFRRLKRAFLEGVTTVGSAEESFSQIFCPGSPVGSDIPGICISHPTSAPSRCWPRTTSCRPAGPFIPATQTVSNGHCDAPAP